MIIANLALTWEHFRAAQVRSLVLMKNVLTVIINPDVSPVMTGTPLPKPAPHSAAVIINIPALVQTKQVVAALLAAENIQHVNVLVDIFGVEVLVPLKMLV